MVRVTLRLEYVARYTFYSPYLIGDLHENQATNLPAVCLGRALRDDLVLGCTHDIPNVEVRMNRASWYGKHKDALVVFAYCFFATIVFLWGVSI